MPKYQLFFQKSRKGEPTPISDTFADRDLAVNRAIMHLDLLAGIGVRGVIAIITTDETFTSLEEANNAYTIRRYGQDGEIEADDSETEPSEGANS